jgi:hypothetical protein
MSDSLEPRVSFWLDAIIVKIEVQQTGDHEIDEGVLGALRQCDVVKQVSRNGKICLGPDDSVHNIFYVRMGPLRVGEYGAYKVAVRAALRAYFTSYGRNGIRIVHDA